jgi:hypothetical protein
LVEERETCVGGFQVSSAPLQTLRPFSCLDDLFTTSKDTARESALAWQP